LDIPFSVVGYSFGTATGLLYGCSKDDVWNMVAIAPPLGKVSFEFMSDCSKPCLCLIGKGDFLYSEEKTEELRSTLGSNAIVEILETSDHFFRGDEDVVAQKVDEFVRDNVIVSSEDTSDAI
jgi:alpha/beta superfamily hydrolase